ncbi:MAG: nitroreductase [Gammaproteobacteria bacterium]|jgi:nitroreductase
MTDDFDSTIHITSADQVLRTTRSVRLRLDLERPVPQSLIEAAIDVAIQAPTGGNSQTWRFIVVTDQAKRERIAELYRAGAKRYMAGDTGLTNPRVQGGRDYGEDDLRQQQMPQVIKSAVHLIDNLHRVPVHIIPFLEGRFESEDVFTQGSKWGSILPAAWSLMLALRARGVASAWTTFTLMYEAEIRELLGVPDTYTQAVLLPVAWLNGGDLFPAKRLPVREVTYWDSWDVQR